ncbi:hypothetical protein TcWFU_005747 [Taenia crassiceps]|uniref:Uncharacterized protein n=1 Tax=Taenia crassiceps TaxID=6207 RepID=A0ABR4QMZ4_9CEST
MSNNDRLEWRLNDFDMGIKDVEAADHLYGGPHHCVVGRNYYGYGTQEKWMQCRMGDLKIYLYKSPRYAS